MFSCGKLSLNNMVQLHYEHSTDQEKAINKQNILNIDICQVRMLSVGGAQSLARLSLVTLIIPHPAVHTSLCGLLNRPK